MSQIDVSAAILVAFAETPLLASRESFSSVGRMLSSLLVLVGSYQTLVCSAAACRMLASQVVVEVGYRNHMRGYYTVLQISAVLWILQGVCTSVTLCTTFLYPFFYSFSRSSTGGTLVLRLCTLFGTLNITLPTINRVTLAFARELAQKREKLDKQHVN